MEDVTFLRAINRNLDTYGVHQLRRAAKQRKLTMAEMQALRSGPQSYVRFPATAIEVINKHMPQYFGSIVEFEFDDGSRGHFMVRGNSR